MTVDGEPGADAAEICFRVFGVLALALWAGVAGAVLLMSPGATEQEGLGALAGWIFSAFGLPLALVFTGAAAIARATDRGGIGWVVLGVVAFLAVCAAPWLLKAVMAVIQ
ncbi:MAG TPA: hypothetical protein VL738_33205 [Dactylosporangium sp.]|jgi:hypothetical protein|nr:hypothetical protein [Dactylosporangium sp.]